MLRDFTLGKYIHSESLIHKIDPRIKIFFCFLYSLGVFFVSNAPSFIILFIFVGCMAFLSRIKLKYYLKNIKIVMPVLILTCISNFFFFYGEETFLKVGFLSIPKNATISCLTIAFRMLLIVLVNSLVSFTTTPINFTKALDSLLKPLRYIKIPVEDIILIITLSIRLIFTVAEQADKIIDAQKVRGADFYSKNILKRLRSYVFVVVPVIISLLSRTKDIETAMECRCYTGQKCGRLRTLKFTRIDILFLVVIFLNLLLIIFVR